MKTTLKVIKSKNPCSYGWSKLLRLLNKTKEDDEPLDLMYILKSNGIEDALWALHCFDYKDYCLFLVDVAESTLHLYERSEKSNKPRLAIEAIRDYKNGKITKEDLKAAADAAYSAANAAACDTINSAYIAAYTTYVAAHSAVNAAHSAVNAAAIYAADAVAIYAADAVARRKKWEEIEYLFIKHFGSNEHG